MRYTRFEKARIIGARALQISMGAPVLIEHTKEQIDPLQLALIEYAAGLIPLAPKRVEVE